MQEKPCTITDNSKTSKVLIQEIIAWEFGNMTKEQEIIFFQKLIDTKMIKRLQECYVKRCQQLIDVGVVYG